MKVGKLEGTPKEIRDVFEDHGLNMADILERRDEPLGVAHIVTPAVFTVLDALTICMRWVSNLSVLFTVGVMFAGWLAFMVHLRWSKSSLTVVAAMAAVILLMVAGGMSLPEVANLIHNSH
jgi:hypothetical protein